MFKKAAAIILCAAMAVPTVNAFAEQPVQTAVIVNEYAAAAKKWDGKTALKSGRYVVSGKVTLSSAVTIPSGVTLTVAKGGSLTITSKGSLNVKGSLSIKSGGSMTVNGKLKLYSGKKLTVGGTLSFGKTSTATLSGKVTVSSFGIISGEPKKVTAGTKASLKADGVVDSEKVAKAFKKSSDTKRIKTMMGDVSEGVFVKGEVADLLKSILPDGVYESLEKDFNEQQDLGYTLDEALDAICEFMAEMMSSEYGTEFKGIDASKLKIEYIGKSDIPAADKSLAGFYKNITAAAKVSGTLTLNFDIKPMETTIADAYLVKIGGVWLMHVAALDELM